MNKLERPAIDDAESLRRCLTHRQPPTRAVLEAALSSIEAAYDTYEESILGGQFEALPFTQEERAALAGNYELTRPGRPLHDIRSTLMAGSRHARCPYCGWAQVGTLDHYLPKASFSEFAILSLNLVPACYRCNTVKASAFSSDGVRIWHAYLDTVPEVVVLTAQVDAAPAALEVTFALETSPSLDAGTFQILEFTFESLRLAEFYRTEATMTVYDDADNFRRAYSGSGPEGLRAYCMDRFRAHERAWGPNHWRAALYRSLAADESDYAAPGFQRLLEGSGLD